MSPAPARDAPAARRTGAYGRPSNRRAVPRRSAASRVRPLSEMLRTGHLGPKCSRRQMTHEGEGERRRGEPSVVAVICHRGRSHRMDDRAREQAATLPLTPRIPSYSHTVRRRYVPCGPKCREGHPCGPTDVRARPSLEPTDRPSAITGTAGHPATAAASAIRNARIWSRWEALHRGAGQGLGGGFIRARP